jgi:hypothetical protein
VVRKDASGSHYRLTIQKQPGLAAGPLEVTVRVPEGARVITASEEIEIRGGSTILTTTFERDVQLDVLFAD